MPHLKFIFSILLTSFFLLNAGCGYSTRGNSQTPPTDDTEINDSNNTEEDDEDSEEEDSEEENPPPQTPLDLCDDPRLLEKFPATSGIQTGSEIVAQVSNLQGARRDQVLVDNFLCGATPEFLKDLKPVEVIHEEERITLCVVADYLSFGTNEDSIRFPLGLPSAVDALGNSGFILPTPKIVDLIYEQSVNKIAPRFMSPGPQMESTAYVITHNNTIEGQLDNLDFGLTGGHKKDVVISNRLASRPNRIAIYGWHRLNGLPIQPLSTVHHLNYGDYSQGIRMVNAKAFINDTIVDLKDLLSDPDYASALSYEGVISDSVLDMFQDTGAYCE